MGWKNKNTVNVSAKGLWKENIFNENPEDMLKDADVALLHLRKDVLDNCKGDTLTQTDDLSSVPIAVSRRMKNTISFPMGSLSSEMIAKAVSMSTLHVHWYGEDAVHGTYDVLDHGAMIDNNFAFVREANGLDHETGTSLENDTYHRSRIVLSGPSLTFRPSVVKDTDQSVMTVQLPLPERVSPGGFGKLIVPSDDVVFDGADTVHVMLGDQSNQYKLEFQNENGDTLNMAMNAADIAHNVKRQSMTYHLGYSVEMPTVQSMMNRSVSEETFSKAESDYQFE